MNEALIVAAARTPVGRHGGVLAGVRPDDLAGLAVRAAVERSGVDPERIEDVVLGCANQAGEDGRNVARMAAILADLPEHVGGTTVNRLCGSGLDAVANAARALMVGDGDAFVAGGVESMSRAPWAFAKPARAYPVGRPQVEDTSLGWRFTNLRMEELGHTDSLGQTAENLVAEAVAADRDIGREAQDAFAVASHRKAVAAQDEGRFDAELIPVAASIGREERLIDADEGPRRDTSIEALARLRPAFLEGGTVTAGNSSPLNDGSAALVLASDALVEASDLEPLARIRAIATAGVAPRVMGIGPVPATAKVLDRAGLTLDDIDLIELNEAFAAQALAVLDAWGIEPEDPRLNVNGGAIAIGHPLGASGARILTTLVHELGRREGSRLGLATMCIGVGQGIAVVVERIR
jgi:acetyl-CoA acetyltransferase family protein